MIGLEMIGLEVIGLEMIGSRKGHIHIVYIAKMYGLVFCSVLYCKLYNR